MWDDRFLPRITNLLLAVGNQMADEQQVNKMMINRGALAALIAALSSVETLYADTLQFGVVGSPIDLRQCKRGHSAGRHGISGLTARVWYRA
jgi:hypothetical protein